MEYLPFLKQVEEGGLQAFMLQSWAESTRECYGQHLRALRANHEQQCELEPMKVLKEYLINVASLQYET